MCPSTKLLTVIERSFDDNDDHSLSQDERITLYTTLAIAPDIVVLKVCNSKYIQPTFAVGISITNIFFFL